VLGEFWCQHPHAKIPKFIDISTCCRHVADMLPTFPAKDGDEGLYNLWSTFFKYPTKTLLKAFRSQIADGSNDCENSINSSNDGVDNSQPLIGVNSLISDDQINTGAGHDISHNKDKRPSVEDDKSSSSDQSSNDSDSDNDYVGATPSRGKNAKSLLNLRQRILPTVGDPSGKNVFFSNGPNSTSECWWK
jgi:hypothetical protein